MTKLQRKQKSCSTPQKSTECEERNTAKDFLSHVCKVK